MIQREHLIQKHAVMWAREAIAVPHKLLAFDRGKASGPFTHMWQKQRGISKATPDTLLIVVGLHIWCEFKAPGEKPSEDQERMGQELEALGEFWCWADSVEEYRRRLYWCGVPLHPNAEFLALVHDGGVATEIAKAEAKAGVTKKPSKPRTKRPTLGQVRRGNAINRVRLGI